MGAAAETGALSFRDIVRMHVIAEDDTEAAQRLKLKVRDAIIDRVNGLFESCESSDEAWKVACENIGLIEAWAREAALENGYAGEVKARAGVFKFDAREYAGKTIPAGEYRAVRVLIGEGAGQNWWCVLYPNLCMPEDYRPGMKVEFYSSIARWIRNVFGGGANG